MRKRNRTVVWMLVAAGVLVAGGCAHFGPDARFQQKTAERDARIDRHIDAFHAREAESAARIAATGAIIESTRVRQQKNLARTRRIIDGKLQYRCDLWPQRIEATRARIDRELAGDPESIDVTIARMFY